MESQKFERKIWLSMSRTENELVDINEQAQIQSIELPQYDIKSMIYVVRNQQVMIDSDLAAENAEGAVGMLFCKG